MAMHAVENVNIVSAATRRIEAGSEAGNDAGSEAMRRMRTSDHRSDFKSDDTRQRLLPSLALTLPTDPC